MSTCKHCGLGIDGPGPYQMKHTEGDQQGKARCALDPYGFLAEPIGAPCGDHPANPCNGARGIEPRPNRERFIERQNKIDALIEASSLGTAQAKAIRDSVDDESVQRILDRVNKRRS